MDQLIELLKQIQDLAGVAIDALDEGKPKGDKPEGGGGKPPGEGGPPPEGDMPPEGKGGPPPQ